MIKWLKNYCIYIIYFHIVHISICLYNYMKFKPTSREDRKLILMMTLSFNTKSTYLYNRT